MDGIVHVSAVDLLTEDRKAIIVASAKGLCSEEIEDLVQQAQASAGEDQRHRLQTQATLKAQAEGWNG